MADELLKRDKNSAWTMGALNPSDEIRNIRVNNLGELIVSTSGGSLPLSPLSGQKVVLAGPTQVALAAVSTTADQLIVVAKITNANNIFIGPTGVLSTTGLILEPGRGISFEDVDLAEIFIFGTAGEGVSFFALT